MLDVKNYAPKQLGTHVTVLCHSFLNKASTPDHFHPARLPEEAVVELLCDLFAILIVEEVLDFISYERFTLPVGVLFQPFLLACLNVF